MVEEEYVNQVPKHRLPTARSQTLHPDASVIFVTTWTEFMTMTSLEIQEVFRRRHILITDTPISTLNFDEEGLSTLAPLHQECVFQGESEIFLKAIHLSHLLQSQRCESTLMQICSALVHSTICWSQHVMQQNDVF